MAMGPGSRVGPYEVTALIGEGGMGKVWRAHHTALNRDDAIKVLPDAFASDADRLARFRREAQVLASLNHPNIAHVYGLEQADGVQALVMELVEGPTLADRITQGAIPVSETLSIAKQIAEALETAHEQGIVHRDLKPANIKLRPDGTVKVLDFGLAKLTALNAGTDANALSMSPTMTSPTMMTGVGVLLGTAPYMAPEQARGKAADKRADIWAFGCVFYEMLTGRRAFDGETSTEVIAKILERDVDFSRLPATVSPAIVRLLRRCLEKDPRRRLRDIGEARFELEQSEAPDTIIVPQRISAGRGALSRRRLIVGVIALLLCAAVVGVVLWVMRPVPFRGARPLSTFAIVLPPDQQFSSVVAHVVALSPRGTHLVYVANGRLYLRPIDQLSSTPIQGTEGGAGNPFFSPDGQSIAFWHSGELKRVSITGGSPVKLCDWASPLSGASWGADGSILLGLGNAGIWRVPDQGGMPERVIAVDEKRELASGPQLLPDGRTVLFSLLRPNTNAIGWDNADIVAESLDTHQRKVLLRGGREGTYIQTGHLIYARGGVLFANAFDVARLAVNGGPVPLVEGVRDGSTVNATAQFNVAADGTLVYVPVEAGAEAQRILAWVTRTGAVQATTAPQRAYDFPRLSPDFKRVAMEIGPQIWLFDLVRDTLTRFTFDGRTNETPLWTPDGKHIVFTSSKDGPRTLYWQLADGSGGLERLTQSDYLNIASSVAPDGRSMAFHESSSGIQRNIMVLALGDRKVRPFLSTPFNEGGARFSPDGRWLAYVSDESGRPEIYVQPFPGPGGKWQVSTDGGTEPAWNPNGRELFYRSGKNMIAVETTSTPSFSAGKPHVLFEGDYLSASYPQLGSDYDVSSDGQKFLMVKETARSASVQQINVMLNWLDQVTRRVPTKESSPRTSSAN
jgi:serine/threonine-protein kinase